MDDKDFKQIRSETKIITDSQKCKSHKEAQYGSKLDKVEEKDEFLRNTQCTKVNEKTKHKTEWT